MAKDKFEEMMDRLPSNIKETDVLRLPSKKVLAALLELLLHSEARESKIIYAPNSRLRKLSGIDNGKLRKKLKEPIIEKSFDDLFSDFFEDGESLEMPINTAITTTTSISTSTTISSSTSIETSTINSAENRNSLQEQNQEELEIIDSEENNLSESQLVSNEIPMEVLISTDELDSLNDHNNADESSTINEGTNDDEVINTDEESYVPTTEELEIWKGCLNIMNPYLSKMQTVTSRMIVDGIKDEIVSKVKDYFNSIEGVTDWVIVEFSKRVADYTHARYDELEELNKKQREKQLQQSSRFAAFC